MIPSWRCLREGCEKYNQTGLGGYCATHKGEGVALDMATLELASPENS